MNQYLDELSLFYKDTGLNVFIIFRINTDKNKHSYHINKKMWRSSNQEFNSIYIPFKHNGKLIDIDFTK